MDKIKLTHLLQRHLDKSISGEEQLQLDASLADPQQQQVISELLQDLLDADGRSELYDQERFLPVLNSILEDQGLPARSYSRLSYFRTARWIPRAAAIFLLLTGVGMYVYINYSTKKEQDQTKTALVVNQDILPGGNKAILTLSDGSKIVLDNAAAGLLTQQGNTKIVKLDSGSLAYNAGNLNGEVFYNTVSTPKGGQYQISLPDGSRVWLNAASSIKFPTAFAKDRKVTISGEVYIEVMADKGKPFLVTANGAEVQVLGTSFNMNAYSDENSIKTTLVEGSVQVIGNNDKIILKPGQQAVLNANGSMKVATPDLSGVLAWKNGLFNFEGLGVEELMRQVERWYNVEVVYTASIPATRFVGEMERNSSLADLLERLKKLGVHTRLEAGRRVVVLP